MPPPPDRRSRRPGVPLVVSVVLHAVVGAGLLELLLMPHPHSQWLKRTHGAPPPVERIGFLALPQTGPVNTPGKSGGNGRPISKLRPAAALVAPSAVPNGVPAAPAPAAPQTGGGTGAVVGAGGAGEGIRPQFSDPRVWVAPSPVVSAPKSTSQQLDSMLASHVQTLNDSLSTIYGGRQPGDWTFQGKNGERWGIDNSLIRLGPVSIPNAVLAMLPINHLGENPVLGQHERQLAVMRQDIMEGAQRQMNEDDFHRAVKEVRERKEREHEELLKMQQQALSKHLPPPTTPPTPNDGSTYAPPPQPNVQ
jgi:hypothetical protein